MKFLEKFKEDWNDTNPTAKYLIIGVLVIGGGLILFGSKSPKPVSSNAAVVGQTLPPSESASSNASDMSMGSVIPKTDRNQGIEDLLFKVNELNDRLDKIEHQPAGESLAKNSFTSTAPVQGQGAATSPSVDLNSALPPPNKMPDSTASTTSIPPVSFDQPSSKTDEIFPSGKLSSAPKGPMPPQIVVLDAQVTTPQKTSHEYSPILPVNSGLDAIMLSGVNARQAGTTPGLVGGVNSANSIGAPFVTRIKGNAILPNGWKLADLGNCFLGGSAVAVLSASRAYATAETLSCIAPDGEVWESQVKAYALDADGTLGIACKVVSKQGTVLMQAALAGVASGLGQALTPMAVPAYNTAAVGGTQSYQMPSMGYIGQTAVGQGVSNAAQMLAKFYLDYANEIFPVCEVDSTTRVTWILKQSVRLHKHVAEGAE